MRFRQKKIELNFNGKKKLIVVDLVPKWFEGIGLMFKSRNYRRRLLFSFGGKARLAIHSLFCFYPFYAIWLDEDMDIIEVRKVAPFKLNVVPRRDYIYLLEVPINKYNFDFLDFVVGDLEK